MAERQEPVLRPTDAEAVRLARRLLRSARFGALATIGAADGAPLATRVATATDLDGAPIILVSALSGHTANLLAEPRCSLLLGEPGKGDPLAHPRISIGCSAVRLDRNGDAGRRARRRYLNRHAKAELYADFADFAFFRLEPRAAALNGGFGRAYALGRDDLLSDAAVSEALAASEQGALDHMNGDHREAIAIYATRFAGAAPADWRLTGIDPDGLDLACGDSILRVFFPEPLPAADALRAALVEMARKGRVEADPER